MDIQIKNLKDFMELHKLRDGLRIRKVVRYGGHSKLIWSIITGKGYSITFKVKYSVFNVKLPDEDKPGEQEGLLETGFGTFPVKVNTFREGKMLTSEIQPREMDRIEQKIIDKIDGYLKFPKYYEAV